MHEETQPDATNSTSRAFRTYHWNEGLDLEISGGVPVWGVSNVGHSGDATWQTDTALDSPIGDASSAPGAGDLVMFVDETGSTGSLSICVTVQYTTEAT
jgi:hypothetical protein